jgi:hypothetical protein
VPRREERDDGSNTYVLADFYAVGVIASEALQRQATLLLDARIAALLDQRLDDGFNSALLGDFYAVGLITISEVPQRFASQLLNAGVGGMRLHAPHEGGHIFLLLEGCEAELKLFFGSSLLCRSLGRCFYFCFCFSRSLCCCLGSRLWNATTSQLYRHLTCSAFAGTGISRQASEFCNATLETQTGKQASCNE